jgi:hypothetical protein
MLQKESVSKRLFELLKELQSGETLQDYFLVGGTALGLQMGHRLSEDIDLFTKGKIDKESIKNFLKEKYGKYDVITDQSLIFQIKIGEIKVDFVEEKYNLVEKVRYEEGVRYLGKRDIAAMKLETITTNGTRAKDFIDIYYLLKEIPLETMLKDYKKKYDKENIEEVKRSLVYFDDVADSDWRRVQLLRDRLNVQELKEYIQEALREYTQKKVIKEE